ncbi:MOSC domain-containing protein [Halobaculum sp. WSA2]|uniref:MOSC domain-containing protein n=1 Tax=Halobaculum saliterrae TaxID=2073113 RepID=A0A6B0T2S3_9EURY|nr:MOSC domain-containing protein [Halobaculum saliterrae]MXR40829.1 MOSC domain-containing protein [Halobaculum saliterrae]
MPASVEALYTAPGEGDPMVEHDRVTLVSGGVEGDRYLRGTGYYSPFDVCAVTLVDAAALESIRDDREIDLTDGRHRRNVVVRGVDLEDLLGATFRIGGTDAARSTGGGAETGSGAVLRGTRPRPPCAHLEDVADEEGVARALTGRRGGICAEVVEPGQIAVGDAIEVVEADPRSEGRRIAERLRESHGE